MKVNKTFKGWNAVDEFIENYGEEMLNRTLYRTDCGNCDVQFELYFNDLKVVVKESTEFSNISNFPVKWINVDEYTCIYVYKLDEIDMGKVNERYEKELAIIHEKYMYLN